MTLEDVAIRMAELRTENKMLRKQISTNETLREEIEGLKKAIDLLLVSTELLREDIELKNKTIFALRALRKEENTG